MGRRIDRVSGGGGDRSRRLERPRASAASRGNLTGGSGRRAGGDPERRGREGGISAARSFFRRGDAAWGRDASRRRTFGGGGADGASGRLRGAHRDAPADASASDAARGRRARGANAANAARVGGGARDARRGDGVRRDREHVGTSTGGARPAPPRSGSPSAGSSGYRRGGGDASANQRPASRRPSRDRFESGSVTRRRIGPSIRDHRERFIGKYASSPRTRRVHTRTTRSNFHRISIEPSTHTRTTIGTSRMRADRIPPRQPPHRIPPPTVPTPHTHIPLPPKKTYTSKTHSPRTSVPPHAAHASPTSASSMCVARHARHVFVGAFVGAVRNVAAHTRPGRSSAGVATAYLAGPNGVRPAAAAAAHRRVTSAEGGRRRPFSSPRTRLRLFARLRSSRRRRARRKPTRRVPRGCSTPPRIEGWWRGV